MSNKHTYPPKRRIYLDTLDDKHIDRFITLSNDPELVINMGWPSFRAGEKKRFMETVEVMSVPSLNKGLAITFSIFVSDEEKPIGYVCLKGMDGRHSMAELGIAIMEKEYRSLGYGSEALELAINYGFNELGLGLIALTPYPFNERAINAYEKVGFVKKEVLEKAWRQESGELVDLLLMEITREQWVSGKC